MRLGKLDLNLLVVLDMLIAERSVSATARRLNLSQPAVTGSLNRLRDYFGDQILVKTGRQMQPTPKARDLAGPVREALLMIRTRIATPAGFNPETSDRHFAVIASDFVFQVLLADVLTEASRRAPHVTFEIINPDRLALERFERGEADLFISITPYLLSNHPSQPLYSDDYAIVADRNGRYGQALSQDDFLAAGHVIPTFGTDRLSANSEVEISRLGLERRIAMRVPSFSALPLAVLGTDRLAIMWRRHASYFARFMDLTVHDLPYAMPGQTEAMQWHALRQADAALQWLRALLLDAASHI